MRAWSPEKYCRHLDPSWDLLRCRHTTQGKTRRTWRMDKSTGVHDNTAVAWSNHDVGSAVLYDLSEMGGPRPSAGGQR